MKALVLILLLAAPASAFTLLDEDPGRARCMRRCDRLHPQPSPEPTRSPAPSPAPLPCEPIGTKTFADGEERMMCFDVAAPTPRPGSFGGSLVQVQSQNHGNASCAHLVMHCVSPTGETYDSQGVQPGCVLKLASGRYYVWTKLVQADPEVCRTYTFTVTR